MHTYSRGDLLNAYLDSHEYARAHPDLAQYYSAKSAALQAAFGIDMDLKRNVDNKLPQRPPVAPDWEDDVTLKTGAYDLATNTASISTHKPNWDELLDDDSRMWSLGLFRHCLESYNKTYSPFDGYIESPPIVAAFWRVSDINACVKELKDSYRETMGELMGIVWGIKPTDTVTGEQLGEFGFDADASAPDPWDYL